MAHGPHCPTVTTSRFLGTNLNVTPAAAATLTLGVSFVKGLLNTLLGDGQMHFGQLGRDGADLVAQAIEHPNTYHAPKTHRFP